MSKHRKVRTHWRLRALAAAVVVVSLAGVTLGATLRGSPGAMREQHSVALQHGLDFYRTAGEIREAAARGDLVPLEGDETYEVADFVSHPYVQPEARLFVERLARQYHEACGQQLVVTSATRAIDEQPWNAHRLSVHPTGMAVDFRVSMEAECREFMEAAMLGMETRGLINGIREFRPPHYHIAIYPYQYAAYAAERIAEEEAEAARLAALAEERRLEIEAEERRIRMGVPPVWAYGIPGVGAVAAIYEVAVHLSRA
jgi:hypothetical protein